MCYNIVVGRERPAHGTGEHDMEDTKEIVKELGKQGFVIDKRKILDTAPIVSLGVTKVRVELYKGVIATINCNVKGND